MMANNGKVWIAMNLEFGLAAQATTEAKTKLTAQIQEYYDEALNFRHNYLAEKLR